MNIINFDDVCYTYPRGEKPALDGINFSVTEGEFLAVMGENGSGKTTLCKLINGIIPHLFGGKLSGKVIVDGCDTGSSSVPELSFKAGIVLDDPEAQLFTSSVRNEAAFGPENICLPPEEIEERVKFALTAVGLNGFEERIPGTLSGGEKQRLSIAASLSMKSRILVLDEPLCRLDPDGAAQVMSVLNDIKIKYRITIVMASHSSGLTAQYADRVCVLKKGRVAALDTVKNIFANPELLENNGIMPILPKSHTEYPVIFNNSPDLHESFSSKKADIPAVNIKNFCYKYQNGTTIENINLSIAENDFAALIGNNGCGKTTLLKSIAGLLRPSSGEIFLRVKNTESVPPPRPAVNTNELSVSDISKEIGFVMQNPDTQLFTDSVFNEVAFALKNTRKKGQRLSNTEIKRRVEAALAAVGLSDTAAYPHTLSRADRTKTIIACVLAMGPRILLFDEADAGCDYKGSLEIMNIAKDLHSKGYTIIFVTHNISLACEYARRIVKMERGGIVFDGRRGI